jgi:DtxR family transcriptional regulator, Mn-dependent transcriptional regulator
VIPAATVSATLEDYLEAISHLIAEKGAARVNDLASALSVHKSTVTAALKRLANKKLVNYSPYELTTLTPQGREVADRITRRHETLLNFLVDLLAIDPETAEANACRIEHAMDREVFQRFQLFASFIRERTGMDETWREKFEAHCAEHGDTAAPEISPQKSEI